MNVTRSLVDSCRISCHFTSDLPQIFITLWDLGIQLLLSFLLVLNLQTQRSIVKVLLFCTGAACILGVREQPW